jgi:hypothetical protein
MKSGSIESPALYQRCDSFQTLLRDLDVMQGLHRTAERRARLLPGSPQGHELVMEAVEDMIMGDVPCDADGSLVTQLHDEVRRRANRLRRDAQRAPFISLDEAPVSALIADPDQEGTSRDELGVPDAPALVRSIRDQAHSDAPVLQLLALYERDIVLRRDVLRAGMKPWTFRYARKRLSQYAAAALARSHMTEDAPLRADPQPATPSPQAARTDSDRPCAHPDRQGTNSAGSRMDQIGGRSRRGIRPSKEIAA